jgi:hypothetical protein
MFIYSVKGQNLKLMLSLALSALIIITVVFVFPRPTSDYIYPEDALPAVRSLSSEDFKNIETNEDRIEFLRLFGWEVEAEAKEIIQVVIPNEFDPVYEKYNQLQIGEGLDLEKYKGKSVKRYTYLVSNYEYDGTVYANLLIYKDRVIGGDICSAKLDGFVHGFTKENNFLT